MNIGELTWGRTLIVLRIDTSCEGVIFSALLNKVQKSCSLRDYSILYIIR